jgi:hypothetical protein
VEKEDGGVHPPFKARMCIFWAWNVFACSTHLVIVVGGKDMDKIIVVIWLLSPTENWSQRVRSSEIWALDVRFWKSVIYFWNPSSWVPLGRLKDFWMSLEISYRDVAWVSKEKNVDSKFSLNLSKVFLDEAMFVLAIQSYHISEKSTPRPLLILLRVVMTWSLSVT